MEKQNIKLGKRFIGYNKEQVDIYFNELQQSYIRRIGKIKLKINDCHAEREKLDEEFIKKEEEFENYTKSKKFLNLALKRADGTIIFMEAAANNESRDIDELSRTKADEYNNKIEKLAKEIKNKQEQLSFLKQRMSKTTLNKTQTSATVDKSEKEKTRVTRRHNVEKVRQSEFWGDSVIENEVQNVNKTQYHVKESASWEEDFTLSEKDEVVKSPAVSQDINLILNKYLIGKIAGDDILDREGKFIVSKNSIITSDIVEKAEQEGKLAELIVNMLLPGMEN